MKFDPTAPPFWEQAKGGPVTKLMAWRKELAARAEKRELRLANPVLFVGSDRPDIDRSGPTRAKLRKLGVKFKNESFAAMRKVYQ